MEIGIPGVGLVRMARDFDLGFDPFVCDDFAAIWSEIVVEWKVAK